MSFAVTRCSQSLSGAGTVPNTDRIMINRSKKPVVLFVVFILNTYIRSTSVVLTIEAPDNGPLPFFKFSLHCLHAPGIMRS